MLFINFSSLCLLSNDLTLFSKAAFLFSIISSWFFNSKFFLKLNKVYYFIVFLSTGASSLLLIDLLFLLNVFKFSFSSGIELLLLFKLFLRGYWQCQTFYVAIAKNIMCGPFALEISPLSWSTREQVCHACVHDCARPANPGRHSLLRLAWFISF